MKLTSMAGLVGRVINLVQKRPAEGANSVKSTFAPSFNELPTTITQLKNLLVLAESKPR